MLGRRSHGEKTSNGKPVKQNKIITKKSTFLVLFLIDGILYCI